MKKRSKRILALTLSFVMAGTLLAGCGEKHEVASNAPSDPPAAAFDAPSAAPSAALETDRSSWPSYLGLAAGGASSQTGIVGAVLAPALTEYLDISISSETSSGMTANLLMVDEGTCELGFTGTDFAYEAWTGTATWTDKTCQNFRSVMPLFPFIQQHYTPAGSGISSVEQLEGKTVNLSTAGSSTDTWMRRVLEVSGINCSITNLSPSDANQQMSDSLVDCAVCNGLAPHSAVSEFAATNNTVVFGISDAIYDKLIAKYPYADRYTIPAGTFEWQTEDIQTISTSCMLIASKDLEEGLVYEMTKAIFENLEELCGQHAAFTYVEAGLVVNCTTPLHAGAARYYTEIGIELPDNIKPID